VADNSSDNIHRPDLSKPAGHLLGDGLVKLIGGLVSAGVLAFGAWMSSMWSVQAELGRQAAEVSFKLDILSQQLAETKASTLDAESMARENARRLDRIEATRFTEQDAAKALVPLEHRVTQLESPNKRR
jgi:hypothetical protein